MAAKKNAKSIKPVRRKPEAPAGEVVIEAPKDDAPPNKGGIGTPVVRRGKPAPPIDEPEEGEADDPSSTGAGEVVVDPNAMTTIPNKVPPRKLTREEKIDLLPNKEAKAMARTGLLGHDSDWEAAKKLVDEERLVVFELAWKKAQDDFAEAQRTAKAKGLIVETTSDEPENEEAESGGSGKGRTRGKGKGKGNGKGRKAASSSDTEADDKLILGILKKTGEGHGAAAIGEKLGWDNGRKGTGANQVEGKDYKRWSGRVAALLADEKITKVNPKTKKKAGGKGTLYWLT